MKKYLVLIIVNILFSVVCCAQTQSPSEALSKRYNEYMQNQQGPVEDLHTRINGNELLSYSDREDFIKQIPTEVPFLDPGNPDNGIGMNIELYIKNNKAHNFSKVQNVVQKARKQTKLIQEIQSYKNVCHNDTCKTDLTKMLIQAEIDRMKIMVQLKNAAEKNTIPEVETNEGQFDEYLKDKIVNKPFSLPEFKVFNSQSMKAHGVVRYANDAMDNTSKFLDIRGAGGLWSDLKEYVSMTKRPIVQQRINKLIEDMEPTKQIAFDLDSGKGEYRGLCLKDRSTYIECMKKADTLFQKVWEQKKKAANCVRDILNGSACTLDANNFKEEYYKLYDAEKERQASPQSGTAVTKKAQILQPPPVVKTYQPSRTLPNAPIPAQAQWD